jgi:hypothetical protein
MADGSTENLKIVIEAVGGQAEAVVANLTAALNKLGISATGTGKATDEAEKKLTGFHKALATLRGGVNSAFNSLTSFKGMIATIATGALVKSFIDAASSVEQFEIKLRTITGSAAETRAAYERVTAAAVKMGITDDEAVQSVIHLGLALDGNIKAAEKVLPALADLAAATGSTTEELANMISVAATTGTVVARGPMMKMAADILGLKNGVKVSAESITETLIKAWQSQSSIFRGASEEMANSWKGFIVSVEAAWHDFRISVMEGGVFDYLKVMLSTLRDLVLKATGAANIAEVASNALGSIMTGVIYGAELAMNLYRTIAIAIESVKISGSYVFELLYDGWIKVAKGVEFARLGWLAIRAAIGVIEGVWDTAVKTISTGISDLLKNFRIMLDAVNQYNDALVPDAVLTKLAAAERAMAMIGRTAEERAAAEEKLKKETLAEADAIKQKLTTLDAEQAAYDKSAALSRAASAVRIDQLKAEMNVSGTLMDEMTQKANKLHDAESGIAGTREQRIKQAKAEAEAEKQRYAELSDSQKLQEELAKLGGTQRATAELAALKAQFENAADLSDSMYQQGLEAYTQYWDDRRAVLIASLNKEVELQRAQLAETDDPTKRAELLTQITAAEDKKNRELTKFDKARIEDKTKLDEQNAERERATMDLRARALEATDATIWEKQQFATEQQTMLQQQEMQKQTNLVTQGLADEQSIRDLAATQTLERAKMAAQQEIDARLLVAQQASTITAGMGEVFGAMYELSGKKAKEWFYAQQALAIATTIIKTYEAAQLAYTSGAETHPVLGAVMAAVAIAQGLARVAMIRAQQAATGGEILGHSPSATADNIPVMATAGEYVLPVRAVRHYGLNALEALRTMQVPRGALAGLSGHVPPPLPSGRFAYAAGGVVEAGKRASETAAKERPININNIVDPALMDQYLAKKPGERSIMNAISRNRFALKQLILGD